jgi:hypothetical protein
MSLANAPTAVLETILARLAALFLVGTDGDTQAARQAALELLTAYQPETPDELALAAQIIGHSFQTLEALAQAATPDLPLTRVLRLRSGAVSLGREAAKAQLRLAQLQKNRQQAAVTVPQETIATAQPATEPENPAAAKSASLTWTQAYQQRQRDQRIAASVKRAEARVAALRASDPHPLPAQVVLHPGSCTSSSSPSAFTG